MNNLYRNRGFELYIGRPLYFKEFRNNIIIMAQEKIKLGKYYLFLLPLLPTQYPQPF